MKKFFGDLSFEEQVNLEVGVSEKMSDYTDAVITFKGGVIERDENKASMVLVTEDGHYLGTNSGTFVTSFESIMEIAKDNDKEFTKLTVVARKSNNGRTFISAKYVG